MVCKQKIKGRVYNISLNEQTLQKGWYLIVTDQHQEYLVQRTGVFLQRDPLPFIKQTIHLVNIHIAKK